MIVNFKSNGITILIHKDMPYLPELEDRVKILDDWYVVEDRYFIFPKRGEEEVIIYLTQISE